MTTKAELLARIAAIEANPASLNPRWPAQVWPKWKPHVGRRLDALAREVAAIIRAERLARGETVNDAGYSGRQANRH